MPESKRTVPVAGTKRPFSDVSNTYTLGAWPPLEASRQKTSNVSNRFRIDGSAVWNAGPTLQQRVKSQRTGPYHGWSERQFFTYKRFILERRPRASRIKVVEKWPARFRSPLFQQRHRQSLRQSNGHYHRQSDGSAGSPSSTQSPLLSPLRSPLRPPPFSGPVEPTQTQLLQETPEAVEPPRRFVNLLGERTRTTYRIFKKVGELVTIILFAKPEAIEAVATTPAGKKRRAVEANIASPVVNCPGAFPTTSPRGGSAPLGRQQQGPLPGPEPTPSQKRKRQDPLGLRAAEVEEDSTRPHKCPRMTTEGNRGNNIAAGRTNAANAFASRRRRHAATKLATSGNGPACLLRSRDETAAPSDRAAGVVREVSGENEAAASIGPSSYHAAATAPASRTNITAAPMDAPPTQATGAPSGPPSGLNSNPYLRTMRFKMNPLLGVQSTREPTATFKTQVEQERSYRPVRRPVALAVPTRLPSPRSDAVREQRDRNIDDLVQKARRLLREPPEQKKLRDSIRERKRRGLEAEAAERAAEEEAAAAVTAESGVADGAKEKEEEVVPAVVVPTTTLEEPAAAQEDQEAAEATESLFAPLTSEWGFKVAGAAGNRHFEKSVGSFTLRQADLRKIVDPVGWMNDEGVNAWFSALCTRKAEQLGWKKSATIPPPFAAFNSAWWTTVVGQNRGMDGISTWSRRVGVKGEKLLGAQKIFFPVNTGAHWTLLIISPLARTIEHLDSLGRPGAVEIRLARSWLEMELGDDYVAEEWKVLRTRSERQTNGSDCGVFTCLNALAAARELSYDSVVDATVGRQYIAAVLINGGFLGDFEL